MRRVLVVLLLGSCVLAACSAGEATSTTGATPEPAATTTPTTESADTQPAGSTVPGSEPVDGTTPDPDRPFDVFVPSSYDDDVAMPLVVALHGFGGTGELQELYFGTEALAEQRGFLLVHPDGTVNRIGRQFWNATDACCGFGSDVDDVAYLTAIIDQVGREYNVDPKRIYFVGHSNGGFMSYRMACDMSHRVAAIASLAGATWSDTSKCDPSEPVSVLQIHGTDDGTIAYDGGTTFLDIAQPGAQATVDTWAGYNGCAAEPTRTDQALDIEANLEGDDTTVQTRDGCPSGVAVELWTITGGSHIPALVFPDGSHPMTAAMIDFLLAHPKP